MKRYIGMVEFSYKKFLVYSDMYHIARGLTNIKYFKLNHNMFIYDTFNVYTTGEAIYISVDSYIDVGCLPIPKILHCYPIHRLK
jgi:hypothetical protein